MIPEPRYQSEVAAILYVVMGDTYYFKGMYKEAITNLEEAQKYQEGMKNLYINLIMGESYYELWELGIAKSYLVKTYIADGTRIFEGEPEKIYKLLEGGA